MDAVRPALLYLVNAQRIAPKRVPHHFCGRDGFGICTKSILGSNIVDDSLRVAVMFDECDDDDSDFRDLAIVSHQ
jgi:hypothetical protein